MGVLVYGSVFLVSAFALHVIVWRTKLPKRQAKWVVTIFTGVLVLGTCVLYLSGPAMSVGSFQPPERFHEYVQLWLLHLSVTLAYLFTYSAIEADSPSLVMISKIAEAGPNGLSVSDFWQFMNDDVLIEPRLRDLVLDKMAEFDGGRYRLTTKGRQLALFFAFYRGLIRAGKGG